MPLEEAEVHAPRQHADVEVRNASCAFIKRAGPDRGEEYVALRDISFAIAPGEFFCLLGPSGCGKSTVLRMVAGFLSPSSGEILIRGGQAKGPGSDRAVVFQGDAALFNWLTTKENIEFGLRMRRVPAALRERVVAENIRLVGLEGFEHYYPTQLSGGMRQRVQIARVLANDPAILLMDEPFGALDAQTRDIMQQELSRIWSSRKKTVLFITHDIDESLLLGDRIAVMTAGPDATIKKVFDVPFARPREIGEDLLELRREIKGAIEEEVMKSMRQVDNANSPGV
jgi:NitT/TauT family transport system ATP-binding protein